MTATELDPDEEYCIIVKYLSSAVYPVKPTLTLKRSKNLRQTEDANEDPNHEWMAKAPTINAYKLQLHGGFGSKWQKFANGGSKFVGQLSKRSATMCWRERAKNFGRKCLLDRWKWHFPGIFYFGISGGIIRKMQTNMLKGGWSPPWPPWLCAWWEAKYMLWF